MDYLWYVLTADWCKASPFSFQCPCTSSSEISTSNRAELVSVTSMLYNGRTILMSRSAEKNKIIWWKDIDLLIAHFCLVRVLNDICICIPSMFSLAVVLSEPQSQTYSPILAFSAFLKVKMRFFPSDLIRMFLDGIISVPSLNHLTSAVGLLSSHFSTTSSFSTAV